MKVNYGFNEDEKKGYNEDIQVNMFGTNNTYQQKPYYSMLNNHCDDKSIENNIETSIALNQMEFKNEIVLLQERIRQFVMSEIALKEQLHLKDEYIKQLNRKIDNYQDDNTKLNNELQSKIEELKTLKQEYTTLDTNYKEVVDKLNKLSKDKIEHTNTIQSLQETKDKLVKENESLTNNLSQIKEELTTALSQIDTLNTNNANLKQQINKLTNTNDDLLNKVNELQQTNNIIEKENIELKQSNEYIQNEINEQKQVLVNYTNDKDIFEQFKTQAIAKEHALQEEIHKLNKQLATCLKNITSINGNVNKNGNRNENDNTFEQLQNELNKIKNLTIQSEQEHKMLSQYEAFVTNIHDLLLNEIYSYHYCDIIKGNNIFNEIDYYINNILALLQHNIKIKSKDYVNKLIEDNTILHAQVKGVKTKLEQLYQDNITLDQKVVYLQKELQDKVNTIHHQEMLSTKLDHATKENQQLINDNLILIAKVKEYQQMQNRFK